ncbi:MAG: hydroxyisourate hydrolase [Acidiferrobacterales bacterium]|nr:hydroxyisourate hydrolase [Acidiferrobacterales bacterium]
MNQITTHILDTSLGQPAVGVNAILFRSINEIWVEEGKGKTNSDGRISQWKASGTSTDQQTIAADYKLVFQTSAYYQKSGVRTFYPHVEIAFTIVDPTQHYHVPLLLNPFGYSTYRGS